MNFFFTHLINIILGRAGIFDYDVLNFFLYSYGIAMEIKKSSRKLMLFLFELSYFASRLKMRSEEVMKKRKKIKKIIRETRNSSLPETTLGHLREVALLV